MTVEIDRERLFADPGMGGLTDAQVLSGLTRYNWMAQQWPGKGARQIEAALRANPARVLPLVMQVAIESGDPIGRMAAEWLVRTPDPVLATEHVFSLPSHTIVLRELAEVLTAQALTGSQGDLELRAGHLNNLGARLSGLGRREDALSATQEAVDIYRDLSRTRPDAFLPDLAMSLNNLGIRLSDLGRREDALAATQEAVDIRRELARTRPDVFAHDLATSISVQGDVLLVLGRAAESAEAQREALTTLLPMLARHPPAFADLAMGISRDYIEACEAARTEPDQDMLGEVITILREAGLIEEPESEA